MLCEQFTERVNGKSFTKLIRDNFPAAFNLSINPKSKRILHGCTVQNFKASKCAMDQLGAHLFCIPARSSDVNPIENLFHQVLRELRKQVLQKQITSETFEEFSERVKTTLLQFPYAEIDKVIPSMGCY